jgi:hypothetical protein
MRDTSITLLVAERDEPLRESWSSGPLAAARSSARVRQPQRAARARAGRCRARRLRALLSARQRRAGRHRAFADAFGPRPLTGGGLGAHLQIPWKGRTDLSQECSRTRAGSPGVNGGAASPPQRQSKVTADGARQVIGGWGEDGEWRSCLLANHPSAAGEAFLFERTGGGGWGDPLKRDPALVLEDVLDEYVSPEAGRDQYGVVVDLEHERVDERATEELRERLPGEPRS